MNERAMYSAWLRVAWYLLEPRDVVQVIEPTIADALHERTSGKGARVWLWRSRWQLICAMGGAIQQGARRSLSEASLVGFTALTLAGLCGAVVLRQGPVPATALGQCAYLVVAAILATIIVAAPTKLIHSIGTLYFLLSLVGLALCPWLGVAYDGQRQWLKIGAFQIHVTTLCLPAFVTFVQRSFRLRRYREVTCGSFVVLGLVLLQNNQQAAVVYALIVGVTLLSRWNTWFLWIMTAALVLVTATTTVHSGEIASWSTLGILALFLANGWALYRAYIARKGGVRSALTLSMAMVALSVLRGLDGDTFPVVGFGGSAVVAFFVLVALQVRADLTVTARLHPSEHRDV